MVWAPPGGGYRHDLAALRNLCHHRHQPVLRFKVFETAVTGSLMQQAQNMLPDLMKQQKALGMVDFASECP